MVWSQQEIHTLIKLRQNTNQNIDRYEANDQRRKRIQAYRIFFNELKTRFWEGPPDQHDVAMDTPTITQRRRNEEEKKEEETVKIIDSNMSINQRYFLILIIPHMK
ncbi:9183_t:CDS:2 [Rhizophagus irregularis]|nr:9183_t:CDS:2 [Rhizophagus irregularis]